MKISRFSVLLSIFSVIVSGLPARAQIFDDSPFKKLEIIIAPQRPPQKKFSAIIKNIQAINTQSGIASTSDVLFRTDDNGATWRELTLSKRSAETIGAVLFANDAIGFAVLADRTKVSLRLAKTNDGGNSWTKSPIILRSADLAEIDLENINLDAPNGEFLTLNFRAPTSSNFVGRIVYQSFDGGQSWTFIERAAEIRRDDAPVGERKSGDWILKTEGVCEGAKTGCVQESKIFTGEREITPYAVRQIFKQQKEAARIEAQNSVFSRPPNGSTRISLNRGFDKCTAAPVAQMQTWWDNSPFYDVNIYMSGRNRGCSQAQLNAAWVNQVSLMGWGLIPTIVGYQAPCSVSTNSAKHSLDPAVAETQGRGEADIAITDATNLGLTQGTVLYYDMERYDETTATAGCRVSVNAFLKGWTDRLHERGYISGTYGSPFNAQADWINLPEASKMDAVWLARWNNVMSVYGVAPLPDNYWTNHQRIHQFIGPRDETWGGVTFNIDNDISDAPVAGIKIAKNKPADFDGDGKSDVSVYRPDTGGWYVLNSTNQSFGAVFFGNNMDTLAPGDFDGDGKTDQAVFRSSEGVWYLRTKAGFVNAKPFGASGDVPVAADYNGDGKTDLAVWRPSNGIWYIANSDSLGTFTFVQFGQTGDKPVPSDFDGDGKTDIAVFRPSNGMWYVLKSADNSFSGTQFGQSGDVPAQGDFDGDGKADFAIFRGGIWYLLKSAQGFTAVQFGLSGDVPSIGDFDGDNKTDLAVFRPSNGIWYLQQSQNGFYGVAFGVSTDRPIPNAYLAQ